MTRTSLPFGPFTLAGYGIGLLLFGVTLLLTRRLPRRQRLLVRAFLGAAILAPGILIDPAGVFFEITPSWLIAAIYGFGMLQYRALDQIVEFFQLMGFLVCGPFLISGPVTFLIVWVLARWLDKRP